jgi:PAS domain S-box-containing protein
MSEYQKVLVVDDDDLIRMMLVRHLENEGYLVIDGEDGNVGLQLIREHRPAVLVLDLAMPNKSGMEMLHDMTEEEIADTSIIVLTGHGGEDDLEECYRLGVRSFLNKPVNFYALLGVVKHAIQFQETRRELISTNQRMDSILRNIPDIVLEIGEHREIRFANDKVQAILGYAPEKIVGSSLKEFIYPEDLTQFEFRFSEGISLSNSALRNLNIRLVHHDGHAIPFQISANSITEEGKESRFVAIARDASDMQLAVQGLSELVDEMKIQVSSDLLIQQPNAAVVKLFGHLFVEEGRNISEFISDETMLPLFEYSFNQKEDLPFPAEVSLPDSNGKMKVFSVQFVYKEPFLEGVLCPADSSSQMALMSGKMEAQSEALNSAVMVDPEMSEEILADCDNLILELLGILKKLEPFAVREETRFILDVYRESSKGKNYQEYQEQLRFLSNKLHSLKGSSGFLIPSAKTLCHTAEGITGGLKELKLVYTDKLASLLKQFIFKIQEFLEMYQENPEQVYDIAEWVEKIETALTLAEQYIEKDVTDFAMFIKERVLLVDDEEIVLVILKKMLKKHGYEVTTVQRSKKALDYFKSHPDQYDLVITDQLMPEMDGTELSKKLLEIKPDLPIILMTGYSKSVALDMLEKLGIKSFLMKPIVDEDLVKAIDSVLK